MTQQKLDLEIKGLWLSPNNLSGMPPGALSMATNVVLNAKSLVESRRGQTQYGSPLSIGTGQINKLFNYSSALIANYDNKLAYDSGLGVWVPYSGTYLPPASGFKMRSLEALRNFYFTTSKGIYKLDAISATPRTAGVEKALGGTGTLVAGTFLSDDAAVAYRIVWGYTDANNNLLLGAPSQRLIVRNSSGSAKDVSLTFLIPSSITTDYFYQIYRSPETATAADEPTDELQLVLQANPTSGEIAAKTFTVVDSTPQALMRAALYTNPSQEGIANSNNQPPYALDMDVFKTCAFYANIKQKQTLSIAMIAVDSPALDYVTMTGNITNASAVVTALTTTNLRVGMRVVGTGVPSNTTVLSIDSGTQVTMSANATATTVGVSLEFQDRFTIAGTDYWAGSSQNVATNQFFVSTAASPGQDIEDTATNLISVINSSASNTLIYGYYTSGTEDLPGQMFFEERVIGGAAFAATSTVGTSFSPVLPTSGTTVLSDNEERQNRVIISKPGQVEAVPVYRFFDIGSANFPITKVVALRDGIFFFKQDGIYRLSGETFQSFVVTLLDNTVVLQVPESAVPFNNQVFCFTTQGVCAVTDSGVRIVSVPIENYLLELASDQYTYFTTASFGVAYESARQYMFFTVTEEADEFATQAFVYNSLTDTWTQWVMPRTCGIVNTSVNKLFMGKTDVGQVMIERKNYTASDFADEEYAITILSIDSDTEATLADATNITAGMTIVQNGRRTIVTGVIGDVITAASTAKLSTGAAIAYMPILNILTWSPIDLENPGILKQYSECSFFFRNAVFTEIEATFTSNISIAGETVPIVNRNSNGAWGVFPWGEAIWGSDPGGQTVLRTYIPREKQRASWINITLSTNQAFTGFSLQGVSIMYNPMSSRIR